MQIGVIANLHDSDCACAEDEEVLDVVVGAESAGDDVHGGVAEDAASGENEEDVAEIRLVLAVKLESLHPGGSVIEGVKFPTNYIAHLK